MKSHELNILSSKTLRTKCFLLLREGVERKKISMGWGRGNVCPQPRLLVSFI